jgi:hypothetical protein
VSEFSESCHLRCDDRAEGVELLRRAKMGGYVFAPEHGWVTVLFARASFAGSADLDARILAANRLLLVQYFYAEDHECGANLYDAQQRVGRVYVSFERDRSSFDRAAFVTRGLLTEEAAAKVDAWARGTREVGNLVLAGALGLPRYEWCSFAYESRNPPRDERVEVDAKGQLVANDDDEDADEPSAAPSSGAPSDGREDGAFVQVRAFLAGLIRDERLELTRAAKLDELTEAVLTELASHPGADPTRTIVECLEEHDAVAELYADDEEVRAALRLTGPSAGWRGPS